MRSTLKEVNNAITIFENEKTSSAKTVKGEGKQDNFRLRCTTRIVICLTNHLLRYLSLLILSFEIRYEKEYI